MSRQIFVLALVALAAVGSQVTSVSAIAQLCSTSAAPVAPQKIRVESQKWVAEKGRVEVVIAYDNPTTANTGCITASTVGLVDSQNQQLGSKTSVSNPITSPIRHTYSLPADSKFTLQYAETATAAGKKARTTVNLQFVTMKAPAPPSSGCSTSAGPVAPQKARIASQVFDSAKGRTTVTFAWDNPTTSSTGCIAYFTLSLQDANGQALGAKSTVSNPLANPLTSTASLVPGQRYVWSYVENETATGAKARTPVDLIFIANGPVAMPVAASSG